MVKFQDNLEWRWKDINSKGIESFIKVMDEIPLTIRKGYKSSEEEKTDCRVFVSFYGTQGDFIISPAKGYLEYSFEEFKGQGFHNPNFFISYNPEGSKVNELNNHECLEIGDSGERFYFLTKPLE